jgi:hypothetical protein
MAIAKDALSTSNLASYTHTPVGTPRGVLVMIPNESATDQVTGVTYGGVAMTEIALSPLLASGAEGGSCYGYFLGSSVPTGAQTVAATISVGSPHIITMTVTADTDTEIVTTGTINETAVTGDRTGTLSTGGRTTVVVEVGWCSASAATSITQITGWTAHNESDEGAEVNFRYSYDTVGTSDVTFGVTVGGTEDVAVLAAAIGEVVGGSTYTLDAAAASYTYTATDATLSRDLSIVADQGGEGGDGVYLYTASDADLTRDMPLSAEAAAYTYTASDAGLEYVPIGSTYTLDADGAAYLYTATDADFVYVQLTHYLLDADSAAYVWTATDVAMEYSGAQQARPLTYGIGPLSPARVRAKWDEIEEIDRRIKAKEEVQREKIRSQQEAKRQLAELQEKKRQTKTIAERRRKLEARIEAYQSEITDLRTAMVAMLDEIEEAGRAREEFEQQQMMADRRRRMLLLIAAAS